MCHLGEEPELVSLDGQDVVRAAPAQVSGVGHLSVHRIGAAHATAHGIWSSRGTNAVISLLLACTGSCANTVPEAWSSARLR